MSKAELIVTRSGEYNAVQPREPVQIACPLNPLDFPLDGLLNFDLVNMPPVSLLINAVTQRPCYEVSGKKTGGDVYLPANLAFFGGETSK
jgi:hypothetical protein